MTFPSLNSCAPGDPRANSVPCGYNSTLNSSGYISPGNRPGSTGRDRLHDGVQQRHQVSYNDNPNYYGNYSNAQVVPFSSDFRSSDASSNLDGGNNASPLVNAVDWQDCPGGSTRRGR